MGKGQRDAGEGRNRMETRGTVRRGEMTINGEKKGKNGPGKRSSRRL